MSGRHLLLVEDDEALRSLFERVLRGVGYRVSAVECLDDAAQVIDGESVDLLVLDEVLPDGSGLGFLRARREAGFGAPALLATGFELASPVQREIAVLGISELLQKPVRPAALLEAAQAVMPPRRPDAPSGPMPLETNMGATRNGLAKNIRGRLATLKTLVDEVCEGRELPIAARRYGMLLQSRAEGRGFPEVATLLGNLCDELASVTPSDPTKLEMAEPRLRALLAECSRRLGGDAGVSDKPAAFLVVAIAAERAVEITRHGVEQGMRVVVVPTPDEAVRLARTEPIRGALLGAPDKPSLWAARELRTVTDDNDLPIGFLGNALGGVRLTERVPGAVMVDPGLDPDRLVAELQRLTWTAGTPVAQAGRSADSPL